MKLYELFSDLNEAPLADIQLHGDWSDNSTHLAPKEKPGSSWEWGKDNKENSFVSKIDRKMAQDITVQSKLRKYFEVHSMDFYLYLVNDPEMEAFHKDLDYSIITPQHSKWSLFSEELRETLLKREANSIQIILTQNEGGSERHALTPWMICHRMCHALIGTGGSFNQMIIDDVKNQIVEILEKCYRDMEDVDPSDQRKVASEFFRHVCTFKSARDNNILNGEDLSNFELFVDALTQYLIKGKVTFKAAPEEFRDQYLGYHLTCSDINSANLEVKELQDTYNERAAKALEFCKGRMFVC